MNKDYQGLFYFKNSADGKPVSVRVEDELIKLYSNNQKLNKASLAT